MPGKYITAMQLRELLGNIGNTTLANWLKDPRKNFPKPIKIGAARLWNAAEVDAYLKNMGQGATANTGEAEDIKAAS